MCAMSGYMSHYGDITVCMDKPYPWFFVARYGREELANNNYKNPLSNMDFYINLLQFNIDMCEKSTYKDIHDTE